MKIRLNYVRDYGTELGKSFIFSVNENKRISIDTDSDNSIRWVWFHDDRADKVVSCFTTVGLVYIENITDGVDLDLNKIRKYDHMFRDEDEEMEKYKNEA